MKIFAISDLHYHPGNHMRLSYLASFLFANATASDVLLLLGDYGNTIENTIRCLQLFLNFPGKKLAVIGNHDLWENQNPNTSKRMSTLMSLFEEMGFHSLDRRPLVIKNIGFAGSIGWYDYSFLYKRDKIKPIQYEYKVYPGEEKPCWQDAIYCDWGKSDGDIVSGLLEKIKMQLNLLKDTEKVFVGMHHVPTDKLLIRPRFFVPRKWRFLNAFLGSNKFSELMNTYKNICTILCGHMHRKKCVTFSGKTYISLGSFMQKCNIFIHDVDTGVHEFVSF
jgi:putative phosphoesterase